MGNKKMSDQKVNIENFKNPTINLEINDNDLKVVNFLKDNGKKEDQEANKNSKTVKIELELNEEELKIVDFIGIYSGFELRSETIMAIVRSQPEIKLLIQEYQSIIEAHQHDNNKDIKKYQDDINNLKNEIIKYNNENKKLKEENSKLKKEIKSSKADNKKPIEMAVSSK